MYKALLSISFLTVGVASSACGSSSSTSASSPAATSSVSSSSATTSPATSSPKFLSFDVSTKTANVLLRAGYDAKAGRNFNGYSKGAMAINVPAGWKVTVTCTNTDVSGEYHSCAAVADESTTTPLLAEATTVNPLN